jgi:rhodanese-related sulfurtransferase
MASIIPSYFRTKKFILGASALTLLLYLSVVLLISKFGLPSHRATAPGVAVNAQQVKQQFATEVQQIQEDRSVSTWLRDDFVVLDIRSTEDYSHKHIRGAINSPIEYLDKATLDSDVDMVIFSHNPADLVKARQILADKHIRSVYVLNDSWDELTKAGYKLAGSDFN